MNYVATPRFRRAARQLSAEARQRLANVIFEIEAAETIAHVANCKEMQGKANKGYYRIRFGDYRLGFTVDANNTVLLVDVGPRGDFYKTYPPK
jgi:mRNA-degrading endonuclease RelE of RelBE toxin-antitoxin system